MFDREKTQRGEARSKKAALLFNFEGASRLIKKEELEGTKPRGCRSVGRAPALQAGGHGFESHHLHQRTAKAAGSGRGRAQRDGLIAQQVRARA